MKHSIAVKFIAITLCALSVLSIAAGGLGIIFMEAYSLYDQTLDERKQDQLESQADAIAWNAAEWYAADTLGNCPNEILNQIMYSYYTSGSVASHYYAEVYEKEELVYEAGYSDLEGDLYTTELTVAPHYPIVSYQYVVDPDAGIEAYDEGEWDTNITEPASYEPTTMWNETEATEAPIMDVDVGIPDTDSAAWTAERELALAKVKGQDIIFSSSHTENFWDESGNLYEIVYNLDYYQAPEYRVVITMDRDAILGAEFALMTLLYGYRDYFIPGILLGLLVFAITLVYLCVAAGRTSNGDIHPAGLNRLPLDLYAIAAVCAVVLLMVPIIWLIDSSIYYDNIWNNVQLVVSILALCVFFIALVVIGFIFAFAAQVKVRGGYWWRHSVCGFLLAQIINFLRWIGRGMGYLRRGIRGVFNLLPVIWQWLLTAVLMALIPFGSFFFAVGSYGIGELFWGTLTFVSLAADVAIVLYGGYCFGTLLKGAKAMSQGNLNHKISTKYLFGAFRDFGEQLNNLAEGAKIAAERQMKSERMKTELITNVSHDIKTPLTSIINYVDLLKKPHTDPEGEQYLEVLDRQSQRLKKLIDDLMEMSKASSGSLTVELGRVDAVEAVNQALGEFADKLASVNLTPVFRYPDFPVTMMADGRLVWRVLSNVLSNAVKYALPDTRLYVDLMVLQGNAVIAIKNISRDQLNVNADELMERFVRGDTSRNTEGSGLGLNIAKSLVELQHGQMHLMVDGDLFKVTLIFPCA